MDEGIAKSPNAKDRDVRKGYKERSSPSTTQSSLLPHHQLNSLLAFQSSTLAFLSRSSGLKPSASTPISQYAFRRFPPSRARRR